MNLLIKNQVTSSSSTPHQSPKVTNVMELSEDILQLVLSYSNFRTMAVLASVSGATRRVTIKSAKKNKRIELIELRKNLFEKLRIENFIKIESLENLDLSLKASILVDIKKELLLAKEKMVDIVIHLGNLISNQDNRDDILEFIARSLGEAAELSIRVAKLISDKHKRDPVLKSIVDRSLGGAAEFEQAIEAAYLIFNQDARDDAYMSIADSLKEDRQFSRAVGVAMLSRNQDKRDPVLKSIARSFAEAGEFSRAIGAINVISPQRRDDAFKSVALFLKESQQFGRAIEFAEYISNQAERDLILKSIPDPGLESIARSFAEAGNFDQAIRVIHFISSERLDDAFKSVALFLKESQQFDRAIEFAEQISNQAERDLVLESIHLSQNELERAVQVAQFIPDSNARRKRFCSIL